MHAGGEQQGDLPTNVGGDGVLLGEDGLGDVGGGTQWADLGLSLLIHRRFPAKG